MALHPLHDTFSDCYSPFVIVLVHRIVQPRVAREDCVACKPPGFPHCVRHRLSFVLEQRHEACQIMHVGKVNPTLNTEGLEGFLGGLLGIKTEIL
nr:hypothetical protein [Salinibacter ruber]